MNRSKFEQPKPHTFKKWLDESYGTKGNRWWVYELYTSDSAPLNRPGKARYKVSPKDRSFRMFVDLPVYTPYINPSNIGPKRWYLCGSNTSVLLSK